MAKRLLIFCGARLPEHSATFVDLAKATGQLLLTEGWSLIYGGGNVGLMGLIAKSAQDLGVPVQGVIPNFMVEREQLQQLAMIGETEFVRTMHERKERMLTLSHAVVLFPGGFGSLDEFFEAVTWKQIGLHNKPLALFNFEGYYDGLLQWQRTAVQKGFVGAEQHPLFTVLNSVTDLREWLLQAGIHTDDPV